MMLQILRGLNHLKNLNIFHRDLKPENIIVFIKNEQNVNRYIYKISDFGCGKNYFSQQLKAVSMRISDIRGTEVYLAPEFKKIYDEVKIMDDDIADEYLRNLRPPDFEKADVWVVAFMAA